MELSAEAMEAMTKLMTQQISEANQSLASTLSQQFQEKVDAFHSQLEQKLIPTLSEARRLLKGKGIAGTSSKQAPRHQPSPSARDGIRIVGRETIFNCHKSPSLPQRDEPRGQQPRAPRPRSRDTRLAGQRTHLNHYSEEDEDIEASDHSRGTIRRERGREYDPAHQQLNHLKIKIPAFHVTNDPEAYLDWERKMESNFLVKETKRVRDYYQEQHGSERSSPTSVIGLSSNTASCVSKEDIKELSQLIRDVEKPLKRTSSTCPSIEKKNQEPVTTVSDIKDVELNSTVPIPEDQAKVTSPSFHKEEQPVQNVMVPIKQAIAVPETPKETQADSGLEQILVFDPYDFQKTFLGTFLFTSFVWNKTRALELSRHEMGYKNVVFEPGGELWKDRNKITPVEKKSAATTNHFGDLLTSGDKVLHVSAQKEFHYETNWKMITALSWIQQTRNHRKWPADLQDIANLAKQVGLGPFGEMSTSDCTRRMQTYFWRPGAYISILINHGEQTTRARICWSHKLWESGRIKYTLTCNKLRKPSDGQVGILIDFGKSKLDKDHPIDRGKRSLRSKRFQMAYKHNALGSSSELASKGYDFHFIVLKISYSSLMHLFCPISAQKGIGTMERHIKRAGGALKIKENPPDELCLQQTQKQPIREAIQGSYLNNQRELSHKTNCHGNLTHQGLTSNWIHCQSCSGEIVMDSTNWVIMCSPCLKLFKFRTSQSYIWRPGEQSKVSISIFNDLFLPEYTDMMHLFLSKEPCADFEEAWEHTRSNYKREEDKRFKPPDLDQYKHQDVSGFIIIKEEPPDAAYKPKPTKHQFGIRLLLFDEILCANLLCLNVFESGWRNVSGVMRTKPISLFYISKPVSNNAYNRGLRGKCNLMLNFNVTNLVPFVADTDLRTNPFQEGEDDVIVTSQEEAEPELVGRITRSRVRELAKEAHALIAMEEINPEEAEANVFQISTIKPEEPCGNH